MIWNANHVLDMALSPNTKRSKDILKDAVAVIILHCVEAGFLLTGSRGSGVLMVKHGDHWSAPSAVVLTATKIGWKFGVEHEGMMIVFVAHGPMIEQTLQHIDNGLSSPFGIGFSKPKDKMVAGETGQKQTRDDAGPATAYVTTNFEEHCFVYAYTDPPHFVGRPLDGVSIQHCFHANERFYGDGVSAGDIVRKGGVTIPEGSEILALQNKLKALEGGTDVTLTPEAIKSKEVHWKKAVEAHETAKSEHPELMEEYTA
jgi:lipid-binding SYLF domain-containing protein